MPRFVLLYHECPPGYDRPPHWDLMLDAGSSLRTWALLQLPRGWEAVQSHTISMFPACAPVSAESSVDAEPLCDHRRDYLEYEGPISGDRGRVTRVDAGSFETLSESRQYWQIELCGERLRGPVTLAVRKANANDWTLTLNGPN